MFKTTLKLAIFLFLIAGFAMVMPAHRVAADASDGSQCPDNRGGAIPASWGINTGSSTHGFASVTVHTSDATPGQNSANLDNIGFTINSQRAPADAGFSYGSSGGNDPDAKIYNWGSGSPDLGGGPGGTGRWSSYRFATGTGNGSPGAGGAIADSTMYLGNVPSVEGQQFHCNGYLELGPGVKVHVPGTTTDNSNPNSYVQEDGNNFVLDCEDDETGIQLQNGQPVQTVVQKKNLFWVNNNIDAPSTDSQYGGHWSLDVYGFNDSGQNVDEISISNIEANPESAANAFSVTNGMNIRIELAWHANPPPHNAPNVTSECTKLDITDGGNVTINGKNFTSDAIRTTVRVTDDSGQVMVHAGSGSGDPVILNDSHPPPGAGDWNPATGQGDWTYTPRSATVHVIVHRQYWHNNSGTWSWDTYEDDSRDHANCYGATCSIQVVGDVPNGPSNGVIASQPFHVSVAVNNTGIVTLGSPSVNGVGVQSGYLNQGDTGYVDFQPNAPPPSDDPAARNMALSYTVSDGTAGTLTSCSLSVPVYQQFTAGLGGTGVTLASTVGTPNEQPQSASYNSTVTVTGGPADIPTHGKFYQLTSTGVTNMIATSDVDNPHPPPDAFSGTVGIAAGTYHAGDRYCVTLHADYTNGYVGPGGPGDVVDPGGGGDFNPNCPEVVNEPYAHFEGSDVSAGGGFGDNCTTDTNGGIYTYVDSAGAQARGSGVQFGAQALGVIEGLSSASLRATAPTGLTGLTFANSVNVTGSPPGNPELGGKFGLSSNCVPDYFSKKSGTLTVPGISTTLPPTKPIGTAGEQYYKPNGGTLTITGGSIGPGVNETIYVEGNVRITNNLTYTGARSAPTDIQSLYIVVKGGNIYIDPGVTQLDGIYVAQPNGSTGGQITTCSNGAAVYSVNNLYDNCKKPLAVNGAFVAQQIFLDRTYSSLRYSQNGENPSSGSSHSCGTVGYDVSATGPANNLDCAAEVFNFNPEVYLAQPAANPTSGPGTGKFDYITSLSPVL